jgi:AraC family transcriptional activator of pobA
VKTINFHKAQCGVEIRLRVGLGHELPASFLTMEAYKTDCFEILRFKKGRGQVMVNQQVISIRVNTIVFISPFHKSSGSWTLTNW